jgi:predicted NAD/FAD-binding protein
MGTTGAWAVYTCGGKQQPGLAAATTEVTDDASLGIGAWVEKATAAFERCSFELVSATRPKVASCETQSAIAPQSAAPSSDYPIISLAEVKKHTSDKSLWVTHEGGVYDVTKFVDEHPGGRALLLSSGGCDMAPFWDCYKVHGRSDYARGFLESYKIGELSETEAALARDPATWSAQHKCSISRLQGMRQNRKRRLAIVLAAQVPCFIARRCVQLIGAIFPWLGRFIARQLPFAVPGYSPGSIPLPPIDPKTGKATRVAVIGGGISGCSSAYALRRAGYDVTVYEARAKLGGNARTVQWSPKGPGGVNVSSDVTVLFMCPEFYKNYHALMQDLGASFVEFYMPYVLHSTMSGKSKFFTTMAKPGYPPLEPNLADDYKDDLRAWDRAKTAVKTINTLACGDSRPSYYKMGGWVAMLNPLNFIGMKPFCQAMGCSKQFWEEIVEPMHALNMSIHSRNVDELPAVALEALDETAPITYTRTAWSWGIGNSQQVFQKLTESLSVRTWTRVLKVDFAPTGEIRVHDDQGDDDAYDRVVFACPASAADSMLRGQTNLLERTLFRSVTYEDEVDRTFMQAVCHEDPSVLPAEQRNTILRDACFVLDVMPDPKTGKPLAEITHNMCPWPPVRQALGEPGPEPPAMIVTHCLHPGKTINEEKVLLRHDYGRSHPTFDLWNLMITTLMPLVQGHRGIYYASNWVTPGNGHDLSCISGMACAKAIGAPYVFEKNELAKLDFDRLSATLGLDENHGQSWLRTAQVLGPVAGLAGFILSNYGKA